MLPSKYTYKALNEGIDDVAFSKYSRLVRAGN